jgi:TonB-dependent starch-binding outer membrane protein SusC
MYWLGGTYKNNITGSNTTTGTGYTSDAMMGAINGATNVMASSISNQYKYLGVFGRLNYIYAQKYILNVTGNRNGSSNFGPGHQYGNFGSIGAGWILSQEKAFQRNLPFISFAKIAGNYGTSGSDGVAPYQYQSFWRTMFGVPVFQGTKPYQVINPYNPDYSWGVKKSLNLGLDIGVLDDRLLANVTWYHNREGNQLIAAALPAQTGFSSVTENQDALIQNSGWEFSLNSNNIRSSAVKWITTFNLSFNRNKLLKFPGLEGSAYANVYVIGQSTNVVQGFSYKSVNPQTGVFEYYKKNGDVTISPDYKLASRGGDRVVIADPQPRFTGGLGNQVTYKSFSLSVFFQFAKQTTFNYLYAIYSNPLPGTMSNLPVKSLGLYWKKPGDNATMERLTTDQDSDAATAASNFVTSSGAYSDDTYLRLKTLEFSYHLTNSLLKNLHLQACRLYISGQNLLTLTNYKIGDPELPGNFTAFPIQRDLIVGLSLNF